MKWPVFYLQTIQEHIKRRWDKTKRKINKIILTMKETFKGSNLGNFYEWAGAIMIFLAFLLFILEGYKILLQTPSPPASIEVVRNHRPNYPELYQHIKKAKKIDSLQLQFLIEKDNLLDSIQMLNRKIDEVHIDNSNTENTVKIVASIIAVIVAAVGFFGFKSLNDIREHTIKNSQIDAKEVAKETAEKQAKETAEEQAKGTLEIYRSKFETLDPLIKSVEEGLSIRINDINTRLDEFYDKVDKQQEKRSNNERKLDAQNPDATVAEAGAIEPTDSSLGGSDLSSENTNNDDGPRKDEDDTDDGNVFNN